MNRQPQQPQPKVRQLPNPPGRFLQTINAVLHSNCHDCCVTSTGTVDMKNTTVISSLQQLLFNIWSYIFYMSYWCFVLGIMTPIVVWIYLPLQCCVQIIRQIYNIVVTILNNDIRIRRSKDELLQSRDYTKELNEGSNDDEVQMCIVITGCDSGFGNELALLAAQELGYTVFAGCLHPTTFWNPTTAANTATTTTRGQSTNGGGGGKIIPIEMDVTNLQQVQMVEQAVRDWLSHITTTTTTSTTTTKATTTTKENSSSTNNTEKERRVLHALINNAGVGRGSIIDWADDTLSDFHHCMDVNYFGMIRCCKAFLPLFKEQVITGTHLGGRILNLTSMAGFISNGVMAMSAYSASKHAANAFSHILRTEMNGFRHIQVCTINPSFHKTPLVDTMDVVFANTWQTLDPKLKEEYGEEYYQRLHELCVCLPQQCKWDMDVVTQQVIQCLRRTSVPPEIIIGSDAKYALMVVRMLPSNIIDFVTRHSFPPIPATMKQTK